MAEADASDCACVVLGVVGPPLEVVLVVRAVRGVGALIRDFLGVSVTCLLLLLRLEEEGVDLAVVVGGLILRPVVTNGCRIAAWGFIRRSGSQTRHLATKSTNSSSLHLRT